MSDGARVNADAAAHQLPDIQGLVAGRIHLDLNRGALQIDQVRALAGGENHISVRGLNHAVVLDVGSNQGDQAARCGPNHALIDDAAGAILLRKVESARKEIGVGQSKRRHHEAADVDLRPGTECDAVLVDQEDAAIGLKGAQDYAGIATGDAVQHLAGRVGLNESSEFARPDREPLPVNYGTVGVGDRQRIAGALEGRASRHHGRIDRVRQDERREARRQGQADPLRAQAGLKIHGAGIARPAGSPHHGTNPWFVVRTHGTRLHADACRAKYGSCPSPSRNPGAGSCPCPGLPLRRFRCWQFPSSKSRSAPDARA
jgi:hypothetical protein